MQTRRWNWLVLVVLGAVAVFVGVAGLLVGAFESSAQPIVFLEFGAGLIIS